MIKIENLKIGDIIFTSPIYYEKNKRKRMRIIKISLNVISVMLIDDFLNYKSGDVKQILLRDRVHLFNKFFKKDCPDYLKISQ